jgi:hypothetical protein
MHTAYIRRATLQTFGLAALTLAALADGQEYPPREVCPEDGGCASTASEPYDLSSFDIPFAYEWPIPPKITRTIRVPEHMSLAAASRIPRARIIVAAGSYGGLTIKQSDQWFDFDDRAIINGSITIDHYGGQERTRFTGGQVIGTRLEGTRGIRDFLIENVDLRLTEGIYAGLNNRVGAGATRVAMINSSTHTRLYSWFLAPQVAATNIILANNNLQGGQPDGREATVRCMTTDRLIIVDNRITNRAKHLFRNHGAVTNTFFARNQLEASSSSIIMITTRAGGASYGDIRDVWLLDNRIYYPGTDTHADVSTGGSLGDGIYNINVEGNETYVGGGSSSFTIVTPSGASPPVTFRYRGNTRLDYVAPPLADAGASR